MSRLKRTLSLDEHLEKVVSDIDSTEKYLRELNLVNKEIEEQIRVRNMEELDALINQSGKSYEEIKAMLMGSGSVDKKKK